MKLPRHPTFASGLVLLVLGIGNWAVAQGRLAEYTAATTTFEQPSSSNLREFRHLDERISEDLLRPLRPGIGAGGAVTAKVDFYKVVDAGGRLLAFTGAGLVLFAAVIVWWHERRSLPLPD
jgi:hypothetical protein